MRDALRVLASRAGHWTFVSSINAYADTATTYQTARTALLDPVEHVELTELTPGVYGATKVASEDAVRAATDATAFVVRPGLITGPGDNVDRFGYWPARLHRGGRVAVPDALDQPIQHVDVRDLAAWIVTAGEERLAGAYDAVGPVLHEMAELVAAPGTELAPVGEQTLHRADVSPWSGPRSLPLWLPASHHGMVSHDATAGQAVRP